MTSTTENQTADAVTLSFEDNNLLVELCGRHDANLVHIEERLGVQMITRGNQIAIFGNKDQAEKAKVVLEDLYEILQSGSSVSAPQVDAALRVTDGLLHSPVRPAEVLKGKSVIMTPNKKVAPRSVTQQAYVDALLKNDLVFGVGPAGTGKTYLAAAVAVHMLMSKQVKKIILTRPVIEAGENLGFLPGTLEEKIDPYLRPLFDALHDFLGPEKTKEFMEKDIIEVAPLAYMRGRTISHAFMLLDEGQNTTTTQMKMFLTRLGEGSRMVVTGDLSQVDLKKHVKSGLKESAQVLEGLPDIEVMRFSETDVVRHDLVSRIVQAYDQHERQMQMKLDKDQ